LLISSIACGRKEAAEQWNLKTRLRLGGAAMISNFNLQRTRRAVERAQQALRAAEDRFDADCRPDNTTELINGIKAAERRLAEARAEFARLNSSATELNYQAKAGHLGQL
jgi:hypothetical protein